MDWDSQNRLIQCDKGDARSRYTYGPDGLRRSAYYDPDINTSGGELTTSYVLEGQNVIRELRGATTNATYLVGPRGVEYRQDAQGAITWYLYDGLGSVVAEVNDNSNDAVAVQIARTYDVYGAVRATDPDPDTSPSDHKFCGKLGHTSEGQTGLTYMRARYYDPVTGRFISEDVAHDGPNWFAYCGSNPINLVDANGRWKIGLPPAVADAISLYIQFLGVVALAKYVGSGVDELSVENAYGELMASFERLNSAADWLAIIGIADMLADAIFGGIVAAVAADVVLTLAAGAHLAVYVLAYTIRMEYYVDMAME